MPTDVFIMQVLFRQPYWCEIIEQLPIVSRRHYLTTGILVLWLLQYFCSLSHHVSWALGIGIVLEMYWLGLCIVWSLSLCILTSLLLNPCSSLHLLGKEVSLRGIWTTFIFGCKGKCLEIKAILTWENGSSSFSNMFYQILTIYLFKNPWKKQLSLC